MSVKSTVGQKFYLYISLYIIFMYHSLYFTLSLFLSASSCFFTLSHSFCAFFSVCFCLRLFHTIFLYILLYLSLSLCLSQSHSLSHSVCLYIFLFHPISHCISLSLFQSVSNCPSVCPTLSTLFCLFFFHCLSLSFFLCLFLSLVTNIPSLFHALLPTPKMYCWFNCVMVIQSRPFLLSESSFILWINLRQSGLLSGFLVLESRFYCKMI